MSVIERSSVGNRVEALLARRAMVGSALGVVRAGRLEFFSGNGFADLAAHRPMTVDTVVRVASITKTFTAIGVMQLVQRGLIDLDVPAERYLRAFPLVPADPGFRPATVRHLLTHTAGIGETAHPARVLRPDFGESVELGTPIPVLADYYRGGLCLRAEPGTRWTYSNHGFAALGQIIAEVSGISLAQYLRENIFRPLGMTDTDLELTPSMRARLATGYRLPGALTDLRARSMIGAGVQVRIHSGRPVLRLLTPVASLLRGLPLHPDDPSDPWVFRVDLTRFGIGTGRIVFARAPASHAMHMHFDLVPMTLLRRGDR